jgi:hypothetical protein
VSHGSDGPNAPIVAGGEPRKNSHARSSIDRGRTSGRHSTSAVLRFGRNRIRCS